MKKIYLSFNVFLFLLSSLFYSSYACNKYESNYLLKALTYMGDLNNCYSHKNGIDLKLFQHSTFLLEDDDTLTITYNEENLNTQYSSTVSTSTTSTCPGILTITVPPGKRIGTLNTEYEITALGGGFKSDQLSYIYSPTLNLGESSTAGGTGTGGTQSYTRALPFASGAMPGTDGTVSFELRAFRTYGGSACNATYNYVVNNTWKLIVTFEDIPTCLPPTNVEISEITANTASINWMETITLNEAGYSYEVRTSGAPGSGSTGLVTSGTTDSTTLSVALTELDQNSTYKVYVKAICALDDSSAWTLETNFTTLCSSVDIPHIVPINATTGTALPACVEREDLNNDGKTWQTTTAQTGITGRVMHYPYHFSNVANDWFFTQGLNLVGGTSYRLKFKYRNSSYQEKLRVSYGNSNTFTAMTNEIFTVTTGTATATVAEIIDFTPQTTGVYYIGFQAFSNANQNSLYVGEISINLSPTCLTPTNIEINDITINTAEVTWDATTSDNELGYSYEVRTSGLAGSGPDGLVFSGTTLPTVTTLELENLDPNTTYSVYIKANCASDDESEWTEAKTFTTPCISTDIPYIVPIDATTGNVLPDCVINEDLNSDGKTWETTIAQGGITGRVMRYPYHTSNQANDWFYTRGLNLTAGVVYRLKFKYKDSSYQEKLRVSYGLSNTHTAMLTEMFTATTGTQGQVVSEALYFSPTTTGIHYIGFQAYSNANQNSLYIGEISVDLAPDCPEPTAISITEITDTTISINWQQFGNATNWEVIVLLNGQTIPDDEEDLEIISVTGNPNVIIEGLNPGTEYTIYIRTICNEQTNSKSEWSQPIKVETLPPPPIRTSDDEYTVEELVREVLIKAPCDLVSNISYISGSNYAGNANSIGYFHKNESIFEYEDGIILATNGIQYAPGPGNGFEGFDSNAWLGDADLQQLLIQNGQTFQNHNATVLEFDFIPLTENIKFDFIFASNEYGTFQCGYSDVFAFFLTDLTTGTTTNLALVPGTTDPVSVVTIRKGIHSPEDWWTGEPECGDANPDYFDKFYDTGNNGINPKFNPINYSGMTTSMAAISEVTPGKKYHIKMAIADYRDSGVNSAVFLRGGSFDLGEVDFGEDLLIEENSALCIDSTYLLDSGLNPDLVEIKWYKDDILIENETAPTYEVTEPGVYTVVGNYESVANCEVEKSIKIEFYMPIDELIKQPNQIDYCRNSLDEFMDLTTVEETMFSEVDNRELYTVTYFSSSSDRENEENAIEDPENFPIPTGTRETIYLRVTNEETGCEGVFEFILNPVSAVIPKNPGNQQVCMTYTFPALPENQYYYSEENAKGIEYKAGDILDMPGVYKIYIYSISGSCFEEQTYTINITAAVHAVEMEDVYMKCENYILPNLSSGSKYYTLSNEQGEELKGGDEITLSQRIYIFTKSEEGPNHCTAESSFNVIFNECPLPKGISPNGDGLNDSFDLTVYGVTSITIYNRFGVSVYSHGIGYTNQWAGQDKSGNLLPDGTYYYVITTHGRLRTGWVQINK